MKIPGLNLFVPTYVNGVDTKLLNPIDTWKDKDSYKEHLNALVTKFNENFGKFNVRPEIIKAGPGFND